MEMHVVLYVFKATFGCCCICTEDQPWVPPCLIIWSQYRITKFYVFAIGCKQLSFEFFIYLFIFWRSVLVVFMCAEVEQQRQ